MTPGSTRTTRPLHRLLPAAIALGLGVASSPALLAADASPHPTPDAVTLDRIVVSSTRLEGVRAFDVPASISVIGLEDGSDRANASVSEALDGVPGLLARERQNYAQDTQLSIRGFGARSTFGVRSLRLYADGIPATMPDGQGQVSHFNLQAADRIEVMRGPFSALYGNSSGGVVQIWSADGDDGGLDARVQATHGRDDTRTLAARLRGSAGKVGYHVAASVFDTDGWRDHSAARRESVNLKLRVPVGAHASLDLVANHFDAPDAQDPLGLTWQQAQDNPRQATAVAQQYNTRKSASQDQLGLLYHHSFDRGHSLRLMAYGGQRDVEQYLPLPIAAQTNPLNSGGVIDLDNRYAGSDLRWSWQGQWLQRPVELSAGLNADRQRQHRQGFENHASGVLGVRGALRRDERNEVDNFDQYAQAWWQFTPRWSLLAGLRHSEVRFASEDRYIRTGNPDDSGRVDYGRTTPVAGLMFAPSEQWRWYLSAGRGFETPTFNELGYRADGGAGLAFDLLPAVSRNVELGSKWRSASGATFEAALFRADTDDELAVARNVGGRSSFRNVGSARRQGVELSSTWPLATAWQLELAYTYVDATFRNDFPICTAAGCTTPTTLVVAGTRIPGVAEQQFSGRLQWTGDVWRAGAQAVAVGGVTVNDLGSERSPGYALLHLDVARDWRVGQGRLRGFARIDNVLDHRYIGSVIVNEGNGRFYEPGPGRGLMLGLRWHWRD